MKRILMGSALVGAFVAWAVPAVAGEADAPPAASAAAVGACCPEVACCNPGWKVSAGSIFAKVRRSDTIYALVDDGVGPAGSSEDAPEVEFDYEIGFRSGISYTTCGPCCWDFGVTGTLLSADADASVTAPQGGTVFATGVWLPFSGQSATSDIEEDYLVIDADAGYTFCGDCLSARVFGGIRFAAIDEDVTRFYEAGTTDLRAVSSTEMRAIGLHAGIEPRFNICRGFSVYGRFGAGVLLGSFDWTHEEAIQPAGGPDVVQATLNKGVDQGVTVLEGALGFSWECDRLFGSCWGIRVRAGYEITRWSFLDFTAGYNFPFGLPETVVEDGAYTVDGFFLTVDLLF